MQIEVSVTKTELVTVNLKKDQIRDVANKETNLVLETLTKNARNAELRKYAEAMSKKTKQPFGKYAEFFLINKAHLYEKNGQYDYHNDVDNDKYIGEISMTDLDEYSITCAKIAEACLLLGYTVNGK